MYSLKPVRQLITKQTKFFLACVALAFFYKHASANSYVMKVDESPNFFTLNEKQNEQISKDLYSTCQIAGFFSENIISEKIPLGNGQERRTFTSTAEMLFDKKALNIDSNLIKDLKFDLGAIDRLFTLLTSIKSDWKSIWVYGTSSIGVRILLTIEQQKGGYSSLEAEITRTSIKCLRKSIRYVTN